MRPEGIHLTLAFLGETPAERLAPAGDALREAAAARGTFEVEIEGGGAFPGGRSPPRVLWAGARGDGLGALAAALREALAARGMPVEDRPFRAHLTLGRVKAGDARAEAARLERAGPLGRFRVEELVLFESELRPEGARYLARARAPLSGRATGRAG